MRVVSFVGRCVPALALSAALCGLSVGSAVRAAEPAAPAAEQPGAPWKSLFDGKTLDGWEIKSGTATYVVDDGAILGTTAEGSGNTFLCTKELFDDFELEFDVLLHDNALNSGVQIRSIPKGEQHGGRVGGPQVEIMAGPGHAGFIYGETLPGGWMSPEPKLKDGKGRHDAFKNGEWNHFRVVAVGPRIRTWINDKPIADLTDEVVAKTHGKGLIGLQVHGIKKGTGPYTVRWKNIRIRPATAETIGPAVEAAPAK